MTNVYFIRHGQAGTRDSYDSLSELGRRQARLLGISDGRIRRLAGVLENTSYTLLQLRGEELLLLSFNSVPHLPSPELRTRR